MQIQPEPSSVSAATPHASCESCAAARRAPQCMLAHLRVQRQPVWFPWVADNSEPCWLRLPTGRVGPRRPLQQRSLPTSQDRSRLAAERAPWPACQPEETRQSGTEQGRSGVSQGQKRPGSSAALGMTQGCRQNHDVSGKQEIKACRGPPGDQPRVRPAGPCGAPPGPPDAPAGARTALFRRP